jgi:hypothetical protein
VKRESVNNIGMRNDRIKTKREVRGKGAAMRESKRKRERDRERER